MNTRKAMCYTIVCGLLVLLAWGAWQLFEVPKPIQAIDQRPASSLVAAADTETDAQPVGEDNQVTPKSDGLEAIYAELEDIFLHSVGMSRELTNSRVQQLNAEINQALPQLLTELKSLPASEKILKRRMALVDYFRYRMRWDAAVIPTLVAYIRAETVATDDKVRAMVMADKAELLGGLAAVAPEQARAVAHEISDPLMKDLAAYEIYFGLQRSGNKSDEQAMAYVRSFAPNFAL